MGTDVSSRTASPKPQPLPRRRTRPETAHCSICLQRNDASLGSAPYRHLYANYVGQKIYIDLIGKLPKKSRQGHTHILVIIDAWSKYAVTAALRDNTANTILEQLLINYIYIYGYPKLIQTDNANEFLGSLIQSFCQKSSIKYIRIPAYHPQANGVVERLNASLKNYLFRMTHERHWTPLDLQNCSWIYNVSTHSSLRETPYFMQFSRDPRIDALNLYDKNALSTETNDEAMYFILKNYERMNQAQNLLHCTFERTDQLNATKFRNNLFQIGQPVLCKNYRRTFKHEPKYIGGFIVVEKINDYTYRVKNTRTERLTIFHVSQLKADLDDAYFLEKEIEKAEAGRENEQDDGRTDGVNQRERFDSENLDESVYDEPINDAQDNQQTDQPLIDVRPGMTLRPRGAIRAPKRYEE